MKRPVSYCHLWSVWICNILPHYLIKDTIFEERFWGYNACFDFLYNFLLKYLSL